MNFSHGMDSSQFLGNFDSTFVIGNNLHHVDSLPQLNKNFVNKN
jgi:hypothetical protein